jgi:hypothetical protein
MRDSDYSDTNSGSECVAGSTQSAQRKQPRGRSKSRSAPRAKAVKEPTKFEPKTKQKPKKTAKRAAWGPLKLRVALLGLAALCLWASPVDGEHDDYYAGFALAVAVVSASSFQKGPLFPATHFGKVLVVFFCALGACKMFEDHGGCTAAAVIAVSFAMSSSSIGSYVLTVGSSTRPW